MAEAGRGQSAETKQDKVLEEVGGEGGSTLIQCLTEQDPPVLPKVKSLHSEPAALTPHKQPVSFFSSPRVFF